MSGTPPRWGSPPPLYSPRGSPRPFIPCPRPTWPYLQSPVPFSPIMWMPAPPSPYLGVPLEPPGPLYHDPQVPQDGRSTADIIASQSQDYVDEKLAEYQATIFQLQDEQERVQKKTFVKWINSYLQERKPPIYINDLIEDLKDGTKLLALLEVLSGEKLKTEKSRNLKRPHFLSNADTALKFLESKRIKLVNINATDLVDGRPPVVLGLIWTIILYFQAWKNFLVEINDTTCMCFGNVAMSIEEKRGLPFATIYGRPVEFFQIMSKSLIRKPLIEEKTRVLASLDHFGGSTSSLEGSRTPDMTERKKKADTTKAVLLKWVTKALPKDIGLEVKDFGPSWRDGFAFLAIIDAIKKGLIDLSALRGATNRDRLQTAFNVAEQELDIAKLLDPEDLDVERPDEKCVMTYVSQFLYKYPELSSDSGDRLSCIEADYKELRAWLLEATHSLSNVNNLPLVFEEYLKFENEVKAKSAIYNKLSKLVDSKSSINIAWESWREIDVLWKQLRAQMRYWLHLLDSKLMPPFGQIGEWLYRAENMLEDEDIPTIMNEETASIISRKLEDHKAFFADLPKVEAQYNSALAHSAYPPHIAQQIEFMGKRLSKIGPAAVQKRIRLKFLEHRCCLIAFMELTENKVRSWTIKYGNEQRVQQLLDQYNNFVSRNKIFQEFNKAFIDMQHVIEEYKRDGNIDAKESLAADRFMRDTSERWKSVCLELRCIQSMLEELLACWGKWHTLTHELEEYIIMSEPKLLCDEEERMEYFQDIGVWKDKHQMLGETLNFLVATSEDQIAAQLKEKYLAITARWERLFGNVKQYMEAGDTLRKKKEYKLCIEKLQTWLKNAEASLENCYLDNSDKISAHIKVLQQIQAEISDVEELFKAISKKFQTLIPDLSRDDVDKMMSTLKKEKERIVKLRAGLSAQLQLLSHVIVQQKSLEESQKEIGSWLNEAEAFMGTLSMAGNKETLQTNLDRHKGFFQRRLFYKSMLESKNMCLASLLSSLKNTPGVDTREFEKKMNDLNQRFNRVSHTADDWQQKLTDAIRRWQNYHEVERVIKEWLQVAEKLMNEKHVDSGHTVDNHKSFFEHVNERWMQDLHNVVQDLLVVVPPEQHKSILDNATKLEEQWKKILCLAPLHLVKLEFRLDERSMKKYLKDLDKELNSQIQAFHRNENINTLQKRHSELLASPLIGEIKKCLTNMERATVSCSAWPVEEAQLKETTTSSWEDWNAFHKKAQEFAIQLQSIPDQWEAYRLKFAELEKWMDTVDNSIKNLLKELATAEEFEKERHIFQGICREAEGKREEMMWMVQTLDMLAPMSDSSEEHEKLDKLLLRYKKLIPVIEMTITKTELYSRCYSYKKDVDEVCKLLDKMVCGRGTVDANSRESVANMVETQKGAVAQLDQQRPNIVSMLQKGRDLGKEPAAPEFVKKQVVELETQWNKAYNTSLEKLNSLKGVQKTWDLYNEGKSEVQLLLERAEKELKQITSGFGGEKLAAELKSKQELCIALRMAAEDILSKLQFYCQKIAEALPEAQHAIVTEVKDLENKLAGTLSVVEQKVVLLQKEADSWNELDTGLKELKVWAVEKIPKKVAQLSKIQVPQERLEKSQVIANEASAKKVDLGQLRQKAEILFKDKDDNVKQDYLKRFKAIEDSVLATEQAIKNENVALEKGVATLHEFDEYMQSVKPWIEKLEVETSMGMAKPVVLSDAKAQLQKAQDHLNESEKTKEKLNKLKKLSEGLPPETLAVNSVDTMHSKWTNLDAAMRQRAHKLEKLVLAWQELEGTAQQVKEWLERPVLQEIVANPSGFDDKDLEAQMEQLKVLKQELNKTQDNIAELGHSADVIASSLTLEGANLLKGKVAELKAAATRASDAIKHRANLISEMLISREDLNSQVVALSTWLNETENLIKQDVNPDNVDNALQAFHIALHEHSEKKPVIAEIEEQVVQAKKSAPLQAEKMSTVFNPLLAKYQDLAANVKQKQQAVEKWRELMDWSQGCNDQLAHLEYQLESNHPLEDIEARLGRIEEEIKAWGSTCPVVEHLCHESGIQLTQSSALPIIQELDARAQKIKAMLLEKKAAKAQIGEQWNKFQQLQDDLSNSILKAQNDVQDIVINFTDCDQLEPLYNKLQQVLEKHNSQEGQKALLFDEGKKLMAEDKKNTVVIQNILSSIELNWEKVNDDAGEFKVIFDELQTAWKSFSDNNRKGHECIDEAEACIQDRVSPCDSTSTMEFHEISKQALNNLKDAKKHIDTMDNKLQIILRHAHSFPNFVYQNVNETYNKAHSDWKECYDKCAALSQQAESQVVIWKQIDEAKGDLMRWLSDTNFALNQALDKLSEPELVVQKLSEFNNELPIYKKLQSSINAKVEQLNALNDGKSTPNLDSMVTLIDDQFAELQNSADKLASMLHSFSDVETNLRNRIKSSNDEIGKIREKVIKCDNLSGENAVIFERLKSCRTLKDKLNQLNFSNIDKDYNDLVEKFPGSSQSGMGKEINSLKKRHSDVLNQANKVDANLLSYLYKYHNEKLSSLQRSVANFKEKIAWCLPETDNDKNSLETKASTLADTYKGLKECEGSKKLLKDSLEMLIDLGCGDEEEKLMADQKSVFDELDALNVTHTNCASQLAELIALWQQFDTNYENISSNLKDIEGKARAEISTHTDLSTIDKKLVNLDAIKENLYKVQPQLEELEVVGNKLMSNEESSRISHNMTSLHGKYQTIEKLVLFYIDRLKQIKQNEEKYKNEAQTAEQWIKDATKTLDNFSETIKEPRKIPLQKYKPLLTELKEFNDSREVGQGLINKAVESGESLFAEITPENREVIRARLRHLRDLIESLIDKSNAISKVIESAILRRNSFEDCFSQVVQWIIETEKKLDEGTQLEATLQDKKLSLHHYRAIAQDINSHQAIFKQLNEKLQAFADPDATHKLDEILLKNQELTTKANSRVATFEKFVDDHESFLNALEKSRDFLRTLISEEAMSDKDGNEAKLSIIENLLLHEDEGAKRVDRCEQLKLPLLEGTEKSGHAAINGELEEHKEAWKNFLNRCNTNVAKLQQMSNKWVKLTSDIDTVASWLKVKEAQVKDQSLKSTHKAKEDHLQKLKVHDEEIRGKGDDIAALVSASVDAETELAEKVSKLSSHYQALKNQSKEMLSRYEHYASEHALFDKKYNDFMTLLKSNEEELKNHNEIVGDQNALQEKQKRLRDLSDAIAKESGIYETLLVEGEKLYVHTSPDGREIIRQQLRDMRNLWDTTNDNLQECTQKLEQCLVQFAEFLLSQEQLTKWLKDVEKAMQAHIELKATLQEKKAQLQNHKIMHQEILGNQALVASVCDKAQSLVDQTQDTSPNVYLQSIKDCFDNIVSKSKDLLVTLENNVENHANLTNKCKDMREWLVCQREALNSCDDCNGEKADIHKRLEKLEKLKEKLDDGQNKNEELKALANIVKKNTTKKGNALIDKEKNKLENDTAKLKESLDSVKQKLEKTLNQWAKFEEELDVHTKWFRVTEAAFKDQQLKASLDDKTAHLNTYKQKREEITKKEVEIDQFVDESHALLLITSVDRIKPLISQISNRYQLLHVLSKEVINRWQSLVDDHKLFNARYDETSALLEPLEQKLKQLETDKTGFGTKSTILQTLASELEQALPKLNNLCGSADKLYPDTAGPGREIIRQQIRDIRNRWDTLEEGIKAQQKLVDAHSIQWNSYQESLTQTLAWLDQMEKTIKQDAFSALTSPHDIRSKLLKQKALLQEVLSHKRIIENVIEKADAVSRLSGKPVPNSVTTMSPRYEALVDHLFKTIAQVEEFLDVVQLFNDLQKAHLDFQQQIKDRLVTFTDFSGNKAILQARLNKITETKESLTEGNIQLKGLEDHVNQNKSKIPQRAKEAMERDITNLRFDFDKLKLGFTDAAQELESRISSWSQYQNLVDQILGWMDEAEIALKNYSLHVTLPEKQAQLSKYQELLMVIESRSRELGEVVTLADHLEQSLLLSSKSQDDLDKLNTSNEFGDLPGEQRLSMNSQQITSRFQAILSTCKEIVKKCEQAVNDHEAYSQKYKETLNWLNSRKEELDEINKEVAVHIQQDKLLALSSQVKNLVALKPQGSVALNATHDLADKVYTSTALEGREQIREQVEELQALFDSIFDGAINIERQLQSKITSWSGFEEICENLQKWLADIESQLPKEIELKATLDEKRTQLQSYRAVLQDAISHQQDIVKLKHKIESLPEKGDHIENILADITKKHAKILGKAQDFVEQYEAIVNCHQEYCKAVMDLQEWIEATHNTVLLWGDLDLERVSLHTNLDRLKNLQLSLPEEEPRVEEIRTLAEKVLPGTITSGQANIRSQVDTSQQDWQSLLSSVLSTINALESKLQQWSEYEALKDECLSWLRVTDTKLHAIDLKATADEKKKQLEILKALQGEIRAKELEIDAVTEKAQQLHKPTTRNSHITELQHKYQQLSGKVKDLTSRWQQYASRHLDFDSGVAEARQWLDGIKTRLQYCSDLSASSQQDLESKLEIIQDLLLCKDEGFVRVQSCIEMGQSVLANTAPEGHEAINDTLEALQQDWSCLVTKVVDTKSLLDECIQKWAGFLEQIQQLNKIVEHLCNSYNEVANFQTTFTEKRTQLGKIKALEEKVRCEKIEVDSLKSKSAEMLASGQQNHAATQAQQILQKFDNISEKIRALLSEREQQFREHRNFKEAQDELTGWLNRAREKLPALKQQSLSDKLAIEDCVAPLQALLNKRAQGELLVEQVQTTGRVAAASSSEEGKQLINNDVKALTESFHNLFKEIQAQKEQLESMVVLWRNYKDEYEKISDWLQQMDIHIKAQKTALLATLDEKKKQVSTVKDILKNLEDGKDQLTKINQTAAPLLSSHLDTYVNSQLRHLNSRYEVQVNLAKDVLRKVETNCEQHEQYINNLGKTRKWLEDAKEIISETSSSASTANKDELRKRLAKIQELDNRREEGQNLVHVTVNCGEKVLRMTRSDGREEITNALKEIQAEWERLIKKISTAKVKLETNLLQWADYNSSYTHMRQLISDSGAKLLEVSEPKVTKTKATGAGLSLLSIGERKAALRQTNSIVQDIVSYEPMIQSVTSKAEDLQQAAPASEITNEYETLRKTAKELYEKQKETIERQEAFRDAAHDFDAWVRSAKERLSKHAEPTGDKESLTTKLTHLKILQNEKPEGEAKLQVALQLGEVACALADPVDKEVIEQEVVLLQDDFDNYVENLTQTKELLESGIIRWNEYEEQYKEAVEWLSQTEQSVQTFNKLQSTLEQKMATLEAFQGKLQALFEWQHQLDNLNLKAQLLLETCADTRVSNAMMQLTTKYNALISLANLVMKRLELHYQEHQQHNSLYQERQQWIDKIRDKVNDCSKIPNTIEEVNSRLECVKGLQQALEQGQNSLRYVLELKEKVILNTEQSGIPKIQEDSESLKQEFERLVVDVQNLRQTLTARGSELEDIHKLNNTLKDWIAEMKLKAIRGDSSDISDTKAELEKFKGIARQIKSQSELVNKIKHRLQNESIPSKVYQSTLDDYGALQNLVSTTVKELENEVKDYDEYLTAHNDAVEWVRKTRISIQQCSDSHGEKQVIKDQHDKLAEIALTFNKGENLVMNAVDKGESIIGKVGPDSRDLIKNDSSQLKLSLESLKNLLRDNQFNISKCLSSWEEFTTIKDVVKTWLVQFRPKVEAEEQLAKDDNQSRNTSDLERVRGLLEELNNKKPAIEELSDKCEVLIELCACNWVRDETVKWQGEYAELFTTVQELLSRAEKNLSDHTEFLKAKDDLEQWLQRAHGTVKDCIGNGNQAWLKESLHTINLVTNRITEGQHKMSVMEDIFKRALDCTPLDKQESLRETVAELHNSWEQLTIDLKAVTAQLNAALSRWDDFYDGLSRMDQSLTANENKLQEKFNTKAELGEMKTIMERLKHINSDLMSLKNELDRLKAESVELGAWSNSPDATDKVEVLVAKWKNIDSLCSSIREGLEAEMRDHTAYHQSLQDIEKWLLKISFQLMAHNSLCITNKDQTLEQIDMHNELLADILGYQQNLNDLRSKGYCQIERYIKTTPQIKPTIEQQLTNVQESYDSLLQSANRIKSRLEESLEKFLEYERTLESIMLKLDEIEVDLGTEFSPSSDFKEAKEQLDKHKAVHNKLQGEKSRLSMAIAACEAAAASISRPSSPLDPSTAPIPDKELNVRIRLEDLIDLSKGSIQDPEVVRTRKILRELKKPGHIKKIYNLSKKVEGRLSNLNQAVQDLEEKDKQLIQLENWIGQQRDVVADWKNKPWKLRAEAAKTELAAMGLVQNGINDNRNRLLMELPQGDRSNAVAAQLDYLEEFLNNTLAGKQHDENEVELYRSAHAAAQQKISGLVKQLEGVDKSHGFALQQRLNNLDGISKEYEKERENVLGHLKQLAENIMNIISNLDVPQVEDQLKSIEKRFNDLGKRIQRNREVLNTAQDELKGINDELQQAKTWVDEKKNFIRNQPPLGFEPKSSEDRVQLLKNLLKEADGKKAMCDSCEKRLNNISSELLPFEFTEVSCKIDNLRSSIGDLTNEIKAASEKAKEASGARKAFEKRQEQVREKMKSLSNQLSPRDRYEPLYTSSVERLMNQNNDYIRDVKKFGEEELNPLQKQASALLKDCQGPEREALQAIINDMQEDHLKVIKKSEDRDKWLKSLLDNRQDFEGKNDKIQQWLDQAEVALSADIRAPSLAVIEEQLSKYSKLNAECEQAKNDIKDQEKTAANMVLSDADRLTVNDNLRRLEQRRLKIASDIAKKVQALGEALGKFKDIKEKVNKSNVLMANVQDRMKDLSKPVGSKVEDVQGIIDEYQKLVDELKDWKANLGGEDIEGLAAVHLNLQDLIKLLEDEIARLRDLLLLREQFIALITEITRFIPTYTPIITEIEASNQPTADKIKRYDEVILKIQSCEALLASATDKGEQIAKQCSAADRNSITEQLQSLKKQLHELRRAVETQKQKLLEAAQQHLKAANDLDLLINWLHSNESEVKQRPLLDITVDSVNREQENHKVLAANVEKYLGDVQKLVNAYKHEEGLPDILQERLSEASSLLNIIPKQLKEREKYLEENKNYRLNYEGLREKLFKWAENSNKQLQSSNQGFNIKEMQNLLNHHNKFFSDEKSLHDLVSIDIHKAGQNIFPSLNSDDQELISKQQQDCTQLLRNTLNTAKSYQAKLTQAIELHDLYKDSLSNAKSVLQRIRFTDEPASALGGLMFNIEKINQALAEAKNHQPYIDVLNERQRELETFLDPNSKAAVGSEVANLNDEWNQLQNDLESRKETLSQLAKRWEEFNHELHHFDTEITAVEDKNNHTDTNVRSKEQLEDTRKILEGLCDTLKSLESKKNDLVQLSSPVLLFLKALSPAACDDVETAISSAQNRHQKLTELLKEKVAKLDKDFAYYNNVSSEIDKHKKSLEDLTKEINSLYVFGPDQDLAENEVIDLEGRVKSLTSKVQKFIQQVREKYSDHQQSVLSELQQKFIDLELLMENMSSAMEEKAKNQKRARTVRTEYVRCRDMLTSWLQQAELKVQDKTSKPQAIKETLQQVQTELPAMSDKLDQMTQNAKTICNNSKDENEISLIKENVNALTEQLAMIRAWIEEKKQQVGDCLDSWERFLTLYNTVMNWCREKNDFLKQPLYLENLDQAKVKLHDYTGAVKNCKNMGKTLSEMSKELDHISENGSIGNLSEKMEEAEMAKAEVEAQLLERHALLHETSEEWEQCEKKLREVRSWISKTKAALEAGAGQKKPLRDQLASKEKTMSDVSIQKTKIAVSIEKLQVHFKSGLSGAESVPKQGEELKRELDSLHGIVKQQSVDLEERINQVEQYQQELLQLKQEVVSSEQKLRMVSSPTYLPNDREKAIQEQNACKEKVRALQSKISARSERVKLLLQRGTPDLDPLLDT
ncbi:nesprin-1 [Cimex lectularius]|uniref:Calponin-homology (CH) domain-containing protein n=1 Tax=Cimex lectularius TaxID=79782 RepID=A0A8I6SSF8_CIMLE|nr:nesprin-1 [Cimex lectularius]